MFRRSVFVVLLVLLAPGLAALGQSIAGPGQMDQCDQASFTITVSNGSVSQNACLIRITNTVPNSGFSYVSGSATITLDETLQSFTVDPIADVWDIDAIVGTPYELPPGETITITFDLATDCSAVSGTDIVTVDFEDCEDPGVPLQNISSTSIEILPGAIVVSKTPSTTEASIGDLVIWTITVENTGLGTVKNVTITDLLGPGLAFDSAPEGGLNAGQETVWDPSTTPSLAELAVGESASVQLTAELIACAGLYNDVDARWGCSVGEVCDDTSVDGGTATASITLIVANPDLAFDPPDAVVPYCGNAEGIEISIVNSGAGTARQVELCCSLALLEVANVQGGASYSDGCFSIPDIPPGETYILRFDGLYTGDWCTGGPSGLNVFTLNYANDCGIPFLGQPQFSTCSSEPGPTLDVSKTGPETLRLGETGAYDLSVAYTGSTTCGDAPGPVTIVDTYPEGFTVVDAAGGVHDPGSRTITWTYDPNTEPPFAATIELEAPTGCGACASPAGGTDPNTLVATGTDCCGCAISGSAEAPTTILCEGFGDDVAYYSSSMSLSTDTAIRCMTPAILTVTHTYSFISDAALNDFLLNEFTYFVDGNGDLQYEPGTASVTGGTLGSIIDNTPSGRLELPLTDSASVSGRTLVYTYDLRVLGLDDPSCQATSYPIYAGIDLEPDATSIGYCGTMYTDPPAPRVTAQPPAMSVSIDGVPVIQEDCATYDITLTVTRTSALAVPYDARLVLTNAGGSIISFPEPASCSGVPAIDGTDCTSPIIQANTFEWRFADGFDGGTTATLPLQVTVPCDGPLIDLAATVFYDDLCNNDSVYDNACSSSASASSALTLAADVYTRKSPEILYATEKFVQWTVVVHNTGNGVAYDTWVDDVLGSGLIYDAASSDPVGAIESVNQDHNGSPINGVSYLFDELQPGELRTITVGAELVACDGLTNDVAVSWGCGGGDCQPPRTDDSIVVIPVSNLVATSFSPTPIPMCSENPATVTAKNAGVTTVYDIVADVVLPDGLLYAGNPEYSVDSGASWLPAGEPSISGQELTWTQTEISVLAEIASKDVVMIRFDYIVDCAFEGGDLTFQAGYEDPCGSPKLTGIGRFTINLTPADVSTTLRQVSPAAGEALDCGGQATWEIDVVNEGSIAVPVIRVEAVLDDGLVFVNAQGDPVYGPADDGSNTGQIVAWEIADFPIDATATLRLTAASAVGGLDCEALNVNVNATWGCGLVDGTSFTNDADCLTDSPASATISGIRRPPVDLNATLSLDAIEGCADTSTLTLEIQNTSATGTVANVDVQIDLPAQLSYATGTTQIDCSGGYAGANDPAAAGSLLTWYDVTADGGSDDLCATILPGDTIRLRFNVDVDCYFSTQNIPITVRYKDCCGLSQYTATTSATLTSLIPNLSVSKTPDITGLDCGNPLDEVTWTIRVTNNGAGTADVVRIEDTLGIDLVHVSGGTQLGSDPQRYGWEFGPLAPGAFQEVTLTARLTAPPEDCDITRRTNTARAIWGCGPFDGDPNTTDEYACPGTVWRQDTAIVQIANLAVGEADIVPIFTCEGDGIGSGALQITVRNTNDGQISQDFSIAISESTTGWSVTDTFTNLGGSLPIGPNSAQTLTVPGWPVACSDCAYQFTVTVDTAGTVCECAEGNNTTVLDYVLTTPNLVFDGADLSVACSGDGSIRIQGPLTVRNDGCGDPLTGTIPVRVTVYDAAGCTGNVLDQFTVDFSGADIAAGGAQAFTLNRVRTIAACDTCEVSIRLELDPDDVICECDGTDNNLCVGPFAIATPDLTILQIDTSGIVCSNDVLTGEVVLTIENTGCGDAAAFDLALATNGCLTFTTQRIPGLGAGVQTTVSFPVESLWTDCGDCSCTFTATIDAAGEICECNGTNNELQAPYTSATPDLEIPTATASLVCASDGESQVLVNLTVENTGCGPVDAAIAAQITLYDGANCTGNVIDQWTAELGTITVAAGETQVVSLPGHTIAEGLCASDCGYSVRVELDPDNRVCECDGTDNGFCISPVVSATPNLLVTEIDPVIDCRAGSAQVRVTVENTGCGDATGVVVDLASAGCSLSLTSAPADIAAGNSEIFVLTYTPTCSNWNCDYTATADLATTVCECDGTDNSFGHTPYPGDGSIGDTVWFDADADGIQDPGEDGIPNVTVILKGDLDGDGQIDYTAEVPTAADGTYLFDGLPAGDYTVTVDENTLPDGLAQTYDADGLGTPHSSDLTLGLNEDNLDQDFGYRGTGSIGDTVWFDANANGVQDPGEDGIPNVTVILEGDIDADGVPETITTTTAADGTYLFDTLPAGDYTVTVDDTTLPAGLGQTYDYDGLGTAHTSDYSLGAGEHNREQDFGYRGTGSIGDTVWFDANGDGVQDPGEDGIPNVTVSLIGDFDADGIIETITAVTDVNGQYLFDHLPAGDYTVVVDDTTLPPGMDQTYDADGLGTPHESSLTLGAGEDNLDQDFGYRGSGSIGDTVWFDANGDGIQDPSEDGIPNVTVTLEGDIDGDGISETLTTTTAADGTYLFEYLPAGDYTITVDDATLPPGLDQTYDYDGLGSAHTSDYTLGAGEHNREQDFGYRGAGSIGDTVWFDANGDGVQDPGESGIANVTLILEGDVDGDGQTEIRTTTTDENGLYLFDFLPAGDYTITVDDATLPPGLEQTYDYDGLGTAHTSDYALGAGEHNREQDFGYAMPALSVDKVVADILRNGLSVGITGPVEPGDLVTYRFVIENVGPVPAYGVGFSDTLPEGLTISTAPPANAGTYDVSSPSATGSLNLADGATTFSAPLGLTLDPDATLRSDFTALVSSDIEQGVDLLNTASAFGEGLDGTPIAGENPALGDTSDTDVEDPDADDTGIVILPTAQPALSVDKVIADILRNGSSVGSSGPVEPGDIIVYRTTVWNVGDGTAYGVEISDQLPAGVSIETEAPGTAGSYAISAPVASGSLGLADGVSLFSTSIDGVIQGGASLTAEYTAVVSSAVTQGTELVNTVRATGLDGAGAPIPEENPATGDTTDVDAEDPDADDTGIAAVGVAQPALSVDKTITDIRRNGASIGIAGPVEPGDIVFYRFEITNVGLATAYHVDFVDTLPTGLRLETDGPGDAGTYTVTDPAASGSLGLSDDVATFTTSIEATLAGGGTLRADFAARVTSNIIQGVDLVNTATAFGEDGAGTPIPEENPAAGDTADTDAEDPDADDTGIAIIATYEPALTVDKVIADIVRRGESIGAAGPVEPGDVIFYRYTIRNIGQGVAYAVDFTDTLPEGLEVETQAPGHAGSYSVSDPASSGSLGLADGVSAFTTTLSATLAGGASLVADYAVLVTSAVVQGVDLINVAATTGVDGAGNPIPGANADLGDTADDDAEDPDADDTGITLVTPREPALSVDKRITDVYRNGVSIGVVDPLLYEDVVEYTVTVRNVGAGTAYGVELTDSLPTGLEVETGAPGNAGSYDVTSPASAGSLGLSDGASSFVTSIAATIDGGGSLVAVFTARITPLAPPSVDLTNTVTATGEDGAGTPIPTENPPLGDTSDDDAEDPDADDTGIATLRVGVPALVTEKTVASIRRFGAEIDADTIEPGDRITFALTITNVGDGPAQNVNARDELPDGLVYEGASIAEWPGETSTTPPTGAPGPELSWIVNASLEPGEALVIRFDMSVPSDLRQGDSFLNVLSATGDDAGGDPIPPDQSTLVPADDDPDDRSHVELIAVEPALVTEKSVADIRRNGASIGSDASIQANDLVVFDLHVTNVGLGTAYSVDLKDELPSPLAYVMDSTEAHWPQRLGSYTQDPLGAPGLTLFWNTNAVLGSGESIRLRFTALVAGSVDPTRTYINELAAIGVDGAGTPIPENNSADVPADTDLDDRDRVELVGTRDLAPALVTDKTTSQIRRGGNVVRDGFIEAGDLITFELLVENVGSGTAEMVNVIDDLPAAFNYLVGSSVVRDPAGSRVLDPNRTGSRLTWPLGATLEPGDRIVVQFQVLVVGPLIDGRAYVNRMAAAGTDTTGQPIPTDQSGPIPADDDPDDADAESLVARSPLYEGMGGTFAVPILRKTAEILGAGPCEGAAARIDRLWFQTDIALFAATEFEDLDRIAREGEQNPDTYLPTWIRTARERLSLDALDNLLQVYGLAEVGIPLENAPRIARAASDRGMTTELALDLRLNELARLAGLSVLERPTRFDWIYLEYAGGEPLYETLHDTVWGPSGTWTVLDRGIEASALGMGLVKQAESIPSLLISDEPEARYLGWVLCESMANKLETILTQLLWNPDDQPSYVPHRWGIVEDQFLVESTESRLFDQASLLWGAARTLSALSSIEGSWPESETQLFEDLHSGAHLLGETVLRTLSLRHTMLDGTLISAANARTREAATATDLGFVLIALEAWADAVGAASETTRLATNAGDQLRSLQTPAGQFTHPQSDTGELVLADQLAGIRGLLAHAALVDDPEGTILAQRAFDALEPFWRDSVGLGLYGTRFDTDVLEICYTPLEIGLAISALQELASASSPARFVAMIERLGNLLRSVVQEAALQLTYLDPESFTLGSGKGEIFAVAGIADLQPAPVLQERLCLLEADTGQPCADWRRLPDDPFYQTDISMYASAVLQDRLPQWSDVADANLVSVVFHSGLGHPLNVWADREDPILDASTGEMTFVPFYGGDPQLDSEEASLAWNEEGFDDRVVASALGMTLLREAQEARELMELEARTPTEDAELRGLLASILAKIEILPLLQVTGPEGVRYVPHQVEWVTESLRTVPRTIDAQTTLFDQLSLVNGLASAWHLFSAAEAPTWIQTMGRNPQQVQTEIRSLLGDILGTLETAHRLSPERVLADRAEPGLSSWRTDEQVTTTFLGLAAEALDAAADAFGSSDPLASRALALLEDQVRFLSSVLWDGSGGYREAWSRSDTMDDSHCLPQTLSGQLAALRALQIGAERLGTPVSDVVSTFRVLDGRFWDPELGLYVPSLESSSWCMSPLDLGLVVGTLTRMIDRLSNSEALDLVQRIDRHAARSLEALDLQLPSRRFDPNPLSEMRETPLRFAPVFDRRVCVEPLESANGELQGRIGDTIRYTIDLENPTEEAFVDLTLVDLLPEGVRLLQAFPTGALDSTGQSVTWTFDRLEPGERRTWELLAILEEEPLEASEWVNCARLTYTNEARDELPEREACAQVRPQALGDAMGSAAEGPHRVWYETDAAMRLATVLARLARQEHLSGDASESAHAMSRVNLGVLLGESGLGVPLDLAPSLQSAVGGWTNSEDFFATLSREAGLPASLRVDAPIFLPAVSAVPILIRGDGFAETDAAVSPAALGWTMAREALFLSEPTAVSGQLTQALQAWVGVLVSDQIRWLDEALSLAGDRPYLAHRIQGPLPGESAGYRVTDPRSFAYDQASLLIGLAAIPELEVLDPDTRSLASALAVETFEQLDRHWSSDDTLRAQLDREEAPTWSTRSVVARALVEVIEVLPELRGRASSRLESLAREALGASPANEPDAEAARITVLLLAAQHLSRSDWRASALSLWDGFRSRPAHRNGGLSFSMLSGLDWPHHPDELAAGFEVLEALLDAGVVQSTLPAISELLSHEVQAAWVQTWTPEEYWKDGLYLPCRAYAPVFVFWAGPSSPLR